MLVAASIFNTLSAGGRFHCEMACGVTPSFSARALTLPQALIARSIGLEDFSISYESHTFIGLASETFMDHQKNAGYLKG
jgi:hypothetical protein